MQITFDRGFEKRMEELALDSRETCLCPARPLIRRLRMARAVFRRYCRKNAGYTRLPEVTRLLLDACPALERDSAGCMDALHRVWLPARKKGEPPALFVFLREAVIVGEEPFSEESFFKLAEIFEHSRPLQTTELDFFALMLRAAALLELAGLAEEGMPEEKEPSLRRFLDAFYASRSLDTEAIIMRFSRVEHILCEDPAGVYRNQDSRTRALYRYRVARTARLSGVEEEALARKLLAKSKKNQRHVGYAIWEEYQKVCPSNPAAPYHFRLLFTLPAILSLLLASWFGNPLWALLFYFPFYEVCRPLLERLTQLGKEPSQTPRMELNGKVPEECRTLIVLSTLLPKSEKIDVLRERLLELWPLPDDGAVGLCLLCDFPSAPEKIAEQDRAQLSAVKKLAKELNSAHGNRLLLLVREREYSKTQREYTGRERKRGAILDLLSLVEGKSCAWDAIEGRTELLYSAKYLFALDWDTGLPPGALLSLVAAAVHPMNRPVVGKNRTVEQGYGILVPRLTPKLRDSRRTLFSRIFSGEGGISFYGEAVSEFWQDQTGSSIFCGKGLLDVEACLTCLPDRFEPETVLSHDILEGGLLRARFVGDTELTEGVPVESRGFFRRLDRWVRGDFQNSPFLLNRVRMFHGIEDNPLSVSTRFQLFDNLRRALTPAAALICLLAGWRFAGLRAVLLLLLGGLAAGMPHLMAFVELVFSFVRYPPGSRTGRLEQAMWEFVRFLALFLLLPQFAVTGGIAAVKGLWRRLVSKRRLLEWAPMAQEGSQKGLFSAFVFYWPQIAAGCFLLFSTSLIFQITGGLFLFAFPAVLYAGRKKKEKPLFSAVEEDSLRGDMRRMLDWFDHYATEEENYLPPDNVQETPRPATAHRTSPTNIGMMLLSYLAARDCGLITSSRLVERVGQVLDTLEEMEKFHGNLYNWYDTCTLEVLPPRFVSSVDSGNLLCCLTALKEGLRAYRKEAGGAVFLVTRIEELLDAADLSIFYDEKRSLFSVGWDSDAQALAPYHYDMLMSEARMMSYYALARRQVPIRHWKALSRTLSRSAGSVGPMSWTGTMFEYFMPELLLHCIKGSIGFAGLTHCVRCQQKRGHKTGTPWGISESGIYSFDDSLNYRYQPNGVQSIALKQGMDDELVVSPYSSYLALRYCGKKAIANLGRIRQMGGYGKYGFYEALDFTQSRVGDRGYETVRSQMSHHLGMSICAIDNALNNNILQKRFLRDFHMRRARELLAEKIPGGEIMVKSITERRAAKRVQRPEEEWEYCGPANPAQPKARILSNPTICGVYTDTGAGWLQSGEIDLLRRPSDLLREPVGSYCFVKAGEKAFSLTPAPGYQKGVSYESAFSAGGVLYTAQSRELAARTEIRIHRHVPCEQRIVTFCNRGKSPLTVTLLFYLEPSLFPHADDDSHKAFSKLFLRVEKDESRQVVSVSRKKRETGGKQLYMAIGFRDGENFTLIPSREDLFSRPETGLPRKEAFDSDFPENGGVPDPCVCLRVRYVLGKNETRSLTLLTCAGETPSDAMRNLTALRASDSADVLSCATERMTAGSLEQRTARMLLPRILFDRRDGILQENAIRQNTLPPRELWRLGISTDDPLVICEVASANDLARVRAYAACHSLLKLSHIPFDLVFLYGGAPETLEAIRNAVAEKCGDGELSGRAGIHIIDGGKLDTPLRGLLFAASCHIASRSLVRIEVPARPYQPVKLRPVSPIALKRRTELAVAGGAFSGNSFFVTGKPALPWCHILANPSFGTLVSDRALGFTWAVNSRELKLTPWLNDSLRDNRGEILLMKTGGKCYDLVCGARAEFNPGYASWQGETNGLFTTVTARVPARGMMKYIEVEIRNEHSEKQEISLAYYTEPCLGVTRRDAGRITGGIKGGALLLHNPFCRSGNAWMALDAGGEEFSYACDRAEFLNGHWRQNNPPPVPGLCAALSLKRTIPAGGSVKVRFQMSFGATAKGALSVLSVRPSGAWQPENKICVESADKTLDLLVNTWLPWQIVSSRIFGRTGFYQNGGAWGFRDQLQDVGAYLLLSPQVARVHILRCCAVQFEEGDVMHWWHTLPETGGGRRGVRTRYSDDLVFLPYTLAGYVRRTGDTGLLDVPVRYLKAPPLEPGQKDAYLKAEYTDYKESVYEHCKRALERAYRLGEHGLPLMGGGDWNDGYNKVGAGGKGESVWLAQFLAMTMREFSLICRGRGDESTAAQYEERATQLLTAVEEQAWDGKWYLRAFYDDGVPMGSQESEVCKIDSLPQSFAVLSDMEDNARLESAMQSAYDALVDRQAGIIRLFTPSFTDGERDPGYVKAYPAGVRENGGQYTHAAVWFALAAGKLGRKDMFLALASMLNPIRRCLSEREAERYKLEPYALAADIYTNENAYGRGGWSLYTGAAGWYYRLLVEQYLGLSFEGEKLYANPCLPDTLRGARISGYWQGKSFAENLIPDISREIILSASEERDKNSREKEKNS